MDDINIEEGLIVTKHILSKMKDKCDSLLESVEDFNNERFNWKPLVVKPGEVNPHEHKETPLGDRPMTPEEKKRFMNRWRHYQI